MVPLTAGTILLVDDEPSLVQGLRRLLARDGYTVDTASTGREAFAHLQTRRYDVIVSGLQMPEVDGRTFYTLARRHYADLPKRMIFITGNVGDVDTLVFLTQSGALWLRKPFTGAEIRHAIRQVLAVAAMAQTSEQVRRARYARSEDLALQSRELRQWSRHVMGMSRRLRAWSKHVQWQAGIVRRKRQH